MYYSYAEEPIADDNTEHDISVIFGYARKLSLFYQGTVIAEVTPEEAIIPSAPWGAIK